MHVRRQRRLARLALWGMVLGLVVLCFASVHLADHPCCGQRSCAICAFLRLGLRPSALRIRPLRLILAAPTAVVLAATPLFISHTSLFTLRVRLND